MNAKSLIIAFECVTLNTFSTQLISQKSSSCLFWLITHCSYMSYDLDCTIKWISEDLEEIVNEVLGLARHFMACS